MTPWSCQARKWQGRIGRYESGVKRARASTRASSQRDVLCAVTDCSKHLIAFRGWRAAKEGPAKKRVHVFPDDLSFFSNFEEMAEGGLSDQCIAVRQTLRVAHPGRVGSSATRCPSCRHPRRSLARSCRSELPGEVPSRSRRRDEDLS